MAPSRSSSSRDRATRPGHRGRSSGFGLATALHRADLGFVVIGLVPDEQAEEALGRAAAERAVEVATVRADLANPQRRAAAVNDLELYALVNNAGYLNAGLIRDVPIPEPAPSSRRWCWHRWT